ncbi:MAG: SURF1 family protein [Rhodobacteraceae bacterium]|nr:SURF1 family protein [Paracoccaceae bacterium]
MTRILAPLLIGLAGIAILICLGVWQIQRLSWKQAILVQIETTIEGPRRPLPLAPTPQDHRYMPVNLTGTIEDGEIHVLVSVKRRGAGYRIIVPLETDDGRRILLDRGFVPVGQRDTERRTGPVSVDGNLHWPDDRNSATPENDVTGNTWFARDIDAMAEALSTAPILVIARSMSPTDASVSPLPVDTSGIPNDHLQYAVTWFSLAGVWLIMTALWIRRQLKGTKD